MKSRRFSPASDGRGPSAPDPFIGRTLGDCTISACLARGRQSAVYQARHRLLKRDVAIKVLSPDRAHDPEAVERFRHEAEMAGVGRHDGLAEVHGSGESNGIHYVVMSLVPGEELSALLFRDGPLREATAVPILRQVAVALATLHRAGVMHGDIQPSNILVSSDEQAVLVGFGQARRLAGPPLLRREDDPTDLPLYFPPEAARGRPLDARTDLYLFGGTLYHVLRGSPPFVAASPEALALLYLRDEPPPLHREAPGTSPALCALVHRLLQKDPAQRFESIGQVLDELAQIETEVVGHVKAITQFRKRKPRSLRHVVRAIGLAGAVVGLVLLGVLFSSLISPSRSEPAPPDALLEAQIDGRDTPSHSPPGPEPLPELPRPTPEPARPAWPEALATTGAAVAHLVEEGRFGEAIARYDALDDAYRSPELRSRTNAMRAKVLQLAKAAYAAVEERAGQLQDDGSFDEARALLQATAERHGVPDLVRRAEERIAAIDRSAGEARARREQERLAAEERAEQERRTRLLHAFETATGRAARSLRVLDVADARRRIEPFDPEDPVIGADVARWRRDIDDVAALKKKTIESVNRASPRVHSSAIGLPGAGGTLERADEQGIAVDLSQGDRDLRSWDSLGDEPILKLASRARDGNAGQDFLAYGILASLAGSTDEARESYLRAEALGADAADRLAPLAAADIETIRDEVKKGQFARAEAALKQFEAAYRGTRWLQTHRPALDGARGAIARGAGDAQAEKLYDEALALFEQGLLYELKPLVARLKAEFPGSTAVRDTRRAVPFARLAAAVETLGVRIVVSQRFGDVRTLREAVQRAEPYSLIEIAGGIPHIESVVIPRRLQGLVLRGTGDAPPVLTAVGALERADDLLTIEAAGVTLERLVLVHGDPLRPLRRGTALVARAGPLRLRNVIAAVALPSGVVQGREGASLRAESGVALHAEACAFVGATLTAGATKAAGCLWVHGGALAADGAFEATNCLFLDGARLEAPATLLRCTALGEAHLLGAPNVLRDCLLYGVRAESLDTQIDYCHVFGRTGVAGKARPGLNLATGKVRFFSPPKLDFRIPQAGRDPASDGGQRGYRPNKTMDALRQTLLRLRSADVVHFPTAHERP